MLVDFESFLLTYDKLGFLCVCICAIPLPVQNRAFQDGHCLNNNNPQHARRTFESIYSHMNAKVSLQVFLVYLLCIFGLASCFPDNFYEHAMCSGCLL